MFDQLATHTKSSQPQPIHAGATLDSERAKQQPLPESPYKPYAEEPALTEPYKPYAEKHAPKKPPYEPYKGM